VHLPARRDKCESTVATVIRDLATIQTHGHDKYKRTLGEVLLPDGMNLNQGLVKQGWCWWYRKYAPGDTVLEGLEKEAPWEWRKLRRL
jgi:endonuclease YncB( thermonuclease family)